MLVRFFLVGAAYGTFSVGLPATPKDLGLSEETSTQSFMLRKRGAAPNTELRFVVVFKVDSTQVNYTNLNFQGPSFTWSLGSLHKRLDKAACNEDWLRDFANFLVLHLQKIESDHRPILVRIHKSKIKNRGQKPFPFLAA